MLNKDYYCIEMHSGLGNQMFIYAYIRALSLRNKTSFKLDISNYKTYFRPYQLEIFDIKKSYANDEDIPFYQHRTNWVISHIKWILIHTDPQYHYEWWRNGDSIKFNPKFLNIKKWYISWHFLSEKYFSDQWDNIKSDFEFVKPISKKTKEIENIINSNNTISIHIRRWDFLKYPNIYKKLDYTYYKNAINMIIGKVKNPMFVIFSDDLDYVYKNFNNLENKIFINHNRWWDSRQDLYLMSKCKHNITANSSFSRRSAYLNKNPKKIIITPKTRFMPQSVYFYNDIIPNWWISI